MVKILILRFSAIGDIVLTTPVVRCLKTNLECEIHYATKKQFLGAIESNPYLDKIHILKPKLQETIQELKAEQFDYIIDLHHNLRTFQIKFQLGVKAFSFNKLNLQKWILTTFKINVLPNKHIVERYLDTLRHWNIKNDNQGLDYELPKNLNTPVVQNPYVALVIGGTHATKRMPAHKLVQLCDKIPYPVVLIGGPDDQDVAEQITTQSQHRNLINTCGKYPLNSSAELVKNSKVVVTHDTGLMHIASAFHKPIVAVWGNTVPEFGMYPYTSTYTNIEVQNLACRPCSKIGYSSCPKKHFKCMEEQDVNFIVNKIEFFWNLKNE